MPMTAIPLERLIEAARAEPSPPLLRTLLRGLERLGLVGAPARPVRLSDDEAAALAGLDLVLDVLCGADRALGWHGPASPRRARLALTSGRVLELETGEPGGRMATSLVGLDGVERALRADDDRETRPLGALLQRIVAVLDELPVWSAILAGARPDAGDDDADAAATWPRVDAVTRARLADARLDDEASLHALAVALRRPPRLDRGAPPVAEAVREDERRALRVLEAILEVVRGRDRVVEIAGGAVAVMTLATGLRCEVSAGAPPLPAWLERCVFADDSELEVRAVAPDEQPLVYLLDRPINDVLDLLPGWREPCALAAGLVDGGLWRSA